LVWQRDIDEGLAANPSTSVFAFPCEPLAENDGLLDGLGELADAHGRAVRSEIASFAMWWMQRTRPRGDPARESFLPFPDQPMKLVQLMADIAVLCKCHQATILT
jgi:hypothetical protein